MDQHVHILNISYHISLLVPHTTGSIWHLSKRLEEDTSWCYVWLIFLWPHVWSLRWGMGWYSPQRNNAQAMLQMWHCGDTIHTSIHVCVLLWSAFPPLWGDFAGRFLMVLRVWEFEDSLPWSTRYNPATLLPLYEPFFQHLGNEENHKFLLQLT